MATKHIQNVSRKWRSGSYISGLCWMHCEDTTKPWQFLLSQVPYLHAFGKDNSWDNKIGMILFCLHFIQSKEKKCLLQQIYPIASRLSTGNSYTETIVVEIGEGKVCKRSESFTENLQKSILQKWNSCCQQFSWLLINAMRNIHATGMYNSHDYWLTQWGIYIQLSCTHLGELGPPPDLFLMEEARHHSQESLSSIMRKDTCCTLEISRGNAKQNYNQTITKQAFDCSSSFILQKGCSRDWWKVVQQQWRRKATVLVSSFGRR